MTHEWMTLLALFVAAAAVVWLLRAQRRHEVLSGELQTSRAQAHALADTLDVWQWRTDAQHRLTQLRPPPSVPSPWPSVDHAPLLWDHFEADAAATQSLRTLLHNHAAIDALAVSHATAGGQRHTLLLRGAALLDAQGRFAGHVGTARELLDSTQQRIDGLLDSLPEPVLRIARSSKGSALCGVNSAAQQWLGLSEAQCQGLAWAELQKRLPGGLRPAVDQALAQPAGAAPTTTEGWELRVHAMAATRPNVDAELLLMFRQRAASSEALDNERSDQEAFSYTVSHDLRAPIRVVEGFTKIVKEDYGRLLDRIGNDHLDRVLGASARMNSMIDSLLALSQLSTRPLSRQPVNLSQLAGYIVDDLRRQSPEREVAVHIEPGMQVQGDATLLRVALENLLGNAWKYTGKARAARIWFERSEHEGRPAFAVRDNGAGFDMRFADRLFGVFQRLHSANDFQGTGVGLASVRRIIRRHGGDIWAEGEVDRGARFLFWISP